MSLPLIPAIYQLLDISMINRLEVGDDRRFKSGVSRIPKAKDGSKDVERRWPRRQHSFRSVYAIVSIVERRADIGDRT